MTNEELIATLRSIADSMDDSLAAHVIINDIEEEPEYFSLNDFTPAQLQVWLQNEMDDEE